MKKVSLLLVGLLVLAAIPILIFAVRQRQELRQRAAPATTLALKPAALTKAVGDSFSIEVAIDTAINQVVIAELHLSFDPAKLEAISITNGPLFPRIYASGVVGNGTAAITVGASDELHPIKGTGTAAIVKFKALAQTEAPISVRLVPTTTFVGGLGEGSTNLLTGSTPTTITVTSSAGGIGGAKISLSNTSTPTPTPTTKSLALASTSTPTPTPNSSITPTPTITSGATPTPTPTPTAQLQINSPLLNATVTAENLQITGIAKPGATITVTIYSNPLTFTTVADSTGHWSVTPTDLSAGPHNLVVTATDNLGNSETKSTAFVLSGSSTAGESAIPVSGNISTTLLLIIFGFGLLILGIIIRIPIFNF